MTSLGNRSLHFKEELEKHIMTSPNKKKESCFISLEVGRNSLPKIECGTNEWVPPPPLLCRFKALPGGFLINRCKAKAFCFN